MPNLAWWERYWIQTFDMPLYQQVSWQVYVSLVMFIVANGFYIRFPYGDPLKSDLNRIPTLHRKGDGPGIHRRIHFRWSTPVSMIYSCMSTLLPYSCDSSLGPISRTGCLPDVVPTVARCRGDPIENLVLGAGTAKGEGSRLACYTSSISTY